MIDTLIGRRFWIHPTDTSRKHATLLSADEYGFCFKIIYTTSIRYSLGDVMFISKGKGFHAILLKETYEVVWGGKEYAEVPDRWEKMQPSFHEYFDTEQEAIAFAKERESEEHPFVLIQYVNHKRPLNPELVEYEGDEE
tara:strand:- start:318 stop:734 length:417 start_codon:yes stop_codon:yes gene_type:complete